MLAKRSPLPSPAVFVVNRTWLGSAAKFRMPFFYPVIADCVLSVFAGIDDRCLPLFAGIADRVQPLLESHLIDAIKVR